MEASEAGSVWPVSASRQCLEVGKRWLKDRELEQEEEQEEEENKEDRVPSCSEGPAGTLARMCAASALHFDLCKQCWSFLLEGLLASSLSLSPPTAQSSQSHCFLHSCSSSVLALSCLQRSIPQGWSWL